MTSLLVLLAFQTPATAADFFPLVPGTRRIYEEKGETTTTIIEEVGTEPAQFDGASATPILQKTQFKQLLGTTYYRVEGPNVLTVGYTEDRSAATPYVGDTVDLTKKPAKRITLLQLVPAVPVFRYEGKETTWSYADIPVLRAAGEEPIRTDETAIKGSAKPIGLRQALDRKVEAIEVRSAVTIGSGKLVQEIVEVSIYGRGVGLLESIRKTKRDGKTKETHTRLIGLEEKPPKG